MKFSTIWTIRGMSFGERLLRSRDAAAREVGFRLPKRVRYWVTLMELGRATAGSPNIPGTKLEDILGNLDAPKLVR